MDIDAIVTDLVVKSLPEAEALRYKDLVSKPPHLLSDDERKFLLDKETATLQRSSAMSLLSRGEPAGCTCNAGMSSHREGCPLYGRPSGASEVMRLFRGTL